MFPQGLDLVRDLEEPPLEDATSFAGRPVEDGTNIAEFQSAGSVSADLAQASEVFNGIHPVIAGPPRCRPESPGDSYYSMVVGLSPHSRANFVIVSGIVADPSFNLTVLDRSRDLFGF
jgi:hypothetical protein